MSWLGTNSGQVINLLDPDPNNITIEDIATGLSNHCRFNGQLKTWYSVAEHSIRVMELVPKHLKKQALLHDATEAFICDVPTPLKRMLGEHYEAIEVRLAAAIGEALNVELVNLDETVHQADRIMVVTERDALTEKPQVWSPEYENSLRYPGFFRRFHTPAVARVAFLEAWEQVKED